METIDRARVAYELGMLRRALWVAPVVLLAAAIALLLGDPPRATLLVLPLAVALKYRGGTLSRAVLPGLVAGFAALLLPLTIRQCAFPYCMSLCLPACTLGGAISGVAIGLRARREENSLHFVVAAVVMAGLLGAMGCSLGGAFGIAGMAAGLLLGGAPALLVTRR
jgi:hypothetical protein